VITAAGVAWVLSLAAVILIVRGEIGRVLSPDYRLAISSGK
jgi:hypothetical protein